MAAVAAAVARGKKRGTAVLSIDGADEAPEVRVARLIRENPAVIFNRRECCMSHVMKRLLAVVGAHPAAIELQEADEEAAAAAAGDGGLPALFVGGVAVGGLEGLMGLHLRGGLVPMLREAGALRI
uniref:Glutaredoxin domain-containing protein n=1 Tax=Musa acuminata subsp. malaccensis TaxID=214687 RepID=A0A804KYN3_MUSAM|nr:PREDICTED: monothiol glutaredoxin-S2-like [Musa acuminata subsp. malaccensis]